MKRMVAGELSFAYSDEGRALLRHASIKSSGGEPVGNVGACLVFEALALGLIDNSGLTARGREIWEKVR